MQHAEAGKLAPVLKVDSGTARVTEKVSDQAVMWLERMMIGEL